ncbi:MAG: hypothetical protein WBB96_04275 [Candidatus Dechloromonas phosphoritropha]
MLDSLNLVPFWPVPYCAKNECQHFRFFEAVGWQYITSVVPFDPACVKQRTSPRKTSSGEAQGFSTFFMGSVMTVINHL